LRVLLGVGLLVAGAGLVAAAPVGAETPAPEATPVVMVRGYSWSSCPGSDVDQDAWGGAHLELYGAGWTGPLVPVSFYACDSDGVDITGYGPIVPKGETPEITPGHPRVAYDQDTSLDVLAHDLAWFSYDSYPLAGTPVDVVGGSLGGLIVRDALLRVAQHEASFPPYLFEPRAVPELYSGRHTGPRTPHA
jgi:hypothetical protein